jgi:hypothetical protein
MNIIANILFSPNISQKEKEEGKICQHTLDISCNKEEKDIT